MAHPSRIADRIVHLLTGIVPVLALALLPMVSPPIHAQESDEAEFHRNLESWAEVYRHILENHYASPDADSLLKASIDGMLGQLDEYSRWSPPLGTGRLADRDGYKRGSLAEGELLSDSIAYVALRRFGDNAGFAVRSILNGLEFAAGRPSGVILDLRGNPGGVLSEAVEVASLFLPRNSLVLVSVGRTGFDTTSYFTENEPSHGNVPLVVLIDYESASSAEVVAAALGDHDRALLLGERTLGKGLIQQPTDLSYGASIRVSTANIRRPSGEVISPHRPVQPTSPPVIGSVALDLERRGVFENPDLLSPEVSDSAAIELLRSHWLEAMRSDSSSPVGQMLRLTDGLREAESSTEDLSATAARAAEEALKKRFELERSAISDRLTQTRRASQAPGRRQLLLADPLIRIALDSLRAESGGERGVN